MKGHRLNPAFCRGIALGISLTASAFGAPVAVAGESFSFADSLSFLKEPLAIKAGGVTFHLRGSLEQGVQVNPRTGILKDKTTGTFVLSGETRLRNMLTVGASYSARMTNRPGSIASVGGYKPEDYSDGAQAFVQGVWGRVTGGAVRGEVDKVNFRSQPAGHAALAFRGSFGRLDKWGGAYSGRYGPAVVALAVDQEGHFDGGLRWSRPVGNKDIGFAVRGTLGTFLPKDRSTRLETTGINVIADAIYGSTLVELVLGYEMLQGNSIDTDRAYASLGLHHKVDAVTLSIMGHYGQVAGNDEVALALGARYDIARGLSANAGVNFAKAKARAKHGTVTLVDKDAVEGSASLKYEF